MLCCYENHHRGKVNLGRAFPYIFLFNFLKIFLNRVIGLLYEQLSDPGAAGSELNSACGKFTKIVDSHSIEAFAQVCSFSAFEQQRFVLKQSVNDF